MPGLAELPTSFAERTLLRWLFLVYLLFILYGSFIPFRFSVDPSLFAPNLFDSSRPTYGHGVRRFSLSDVVSNVRLCIPFGFLWVGGEFYLRMQNRFWRVAFAGGVLGLLSGLIIESGQMFSPGRIASILDATSSRLLARSVGPT
jgi:VanZ family protein